MKRKRLTTGSRVLCRLFNKAEGKFYGAPFIGEVTAYGVMRDWIVRADGLPEPRAPFDLWRKEIRRIL